MCKCKNLELVSSHMLVYMFSPASCSFTGQHHYSKMSLFQILFYSSKYETSDMIFFLFQCVYKSEHVATKIPQIKTQGGLEALLSLTCGIKLTWMLQKFSLFTLNWNCLKASMNGMLSMSPTVPPNCKHGTNTG